MFSFGVFVHLDIPIIESYLDNIKTIIRPGADVIIQYSDKTKEWARRNLTFSDNDPTRMCALITARGYRIVREDRERLPHSSIVHFTKYESAHPIPLSKIPQRCGYFTVARISSAAAEM